jgi:hypothetical protein
MLHEALEYRGVGSSADAAPSKMKPLQILWTLLEAGGFTLQSAAD